VGSYFSGSVQSGSTSASYTGSLSSDIFVNGNLKINSIFSGSTFSPIFVFDGTFFSGSSISGSIYSSGNFSGSFYTSSTYNTSFSFNPLEVHAHECPDLTQLDFSNNYYMRVVDIISCSNLQYVNFLGDPYLNSITLTHCPLLMTMSFTWPYVSQSAFNAFLVQEVTESYIKPSGVILRIGGQPRRIPRDSWLALNKLISRGYDIEYVENIVQSTPSPAPTADETSLI